MKSNRDYQERGLLARKKIENYSYYLNQEIGRGYSSKVFKGKNDLTHEVVAIKVIDMKMLKSQIHKSLLISQIDCLRSLNSYNTPYCLKIIQVYSTKNNTYLITQMCTEGDLSKVIGKHPIQQFLLIRQKQAVRLIKQIIKGYIAICNNNIIHRDIKPTNIFLKNGNPKIADFGFAIKVKPGENNKTSSYNVGSPLYMSPQALKDNKYSFKSDIWALGVVFYQLLTANTPWKARSQKQLCKKIQRQPISGILPLNLSQKSRQFLCKSMDINLNNRFNPSQLQKFSFEQQPSINTSVCINSSINNLKIDNHYDHSGAIRKDGNQKQNNKINNFDYTSPKGCELSNNKINDDSINRNSISYLSNAHKYIFTQPLKDTNSKEKKCSKNALKILISQIHLCRYLYKLTKQLQQTKISQFEYKFFDLQFLFNKFIMLKFQRLKQMIVLKINTFNLPNFQQLTFSQQFTKIRNVVNQYIDKYKNNTFNQRMYMLQPSLLAMKDQNNIIPILEKMLDVIAPVIKDLRDHIKSIMPNPNLNHYQVMDQTLKGKIITLDYLITCFQLIDLIMRNPFDFQFFSIQSKIQIIVDGKPQRITTVHFQKIKQKILQLSI